VTVSHGHLAFFGAYVMLNLMVFYYAMPKLKGVEEYDDTRGKVAFWIMISAMFCLGLAFGVAGVLQAYLERMLGMGYMAAQEHMRFWFVVAFFCGIGFLVGVVLTVYDLFFLKPKVQAVPVGEPAAQPAS
jgi:nitric oxide reductase subunit B